jgi:SAM-dependent methyltransferase
MNSPIAKKNKNSFQRFLIRLHQKYSQDTRSVILGNIIAGVIKNEIVCSEKISVLDFGCGDMKIAAEINKKIPNIDWTGTDIYENYNEKFPFRYVNSENSSLPFEDKAFDIVVMSDVLHHIVEDEQIPILKECLRVGKKVVIKDSFEKGYFFRLILILMDIVGNWAYGVRIPNRYFTRLRFTEMCIKNNIHCEIKVKEIELYNHLSACIKLLSPPDLHFVAVLKNEKSIKESKVNKL